MKYNQHIEKSAQLLEEELGVSRLRAENMIREYLKTLPGIMSEIKSSLKMTETLRSHIHSLKGTSANLRLNLIFDAARAFEIAIAGGHKENFPLQFENLKNAVNFYI